MWQIQLQGASTPLGSCAARRTRRRSAVVTSASRMSAAAADECVGGCCTPAAAAAARWVGRGDECFGAHPRWTRLEARCAAAPYCGRWRATMSFARAAAAHAARGTRCLLALVRPPRLPGRGLSYALVRCARTRACMRSRPPSPRSVLGWSGSMGELARTGEEPNLSHIAALWPVLLMTSAAGIGGGGAAWQRSPVRTSRAFWGQHELANMSWRRRHRRPCSCPCVISVAWHMLTQGDVRMTP